MQVRKSVAEVGALYRTSIVFCKGCVDKREVILNDQFGIEVVVSLADTWIKGSADNRPYHILHVASPAECRYERVSQKSVLCVVKVLCSVRDAWIKGDIFTVSAWEGGGRAPHGIRGIKGHGLLEISHISGRTLYEMRGLKVLIPFFKIVTQSRIPHGMRGLKERSQRI